MEHAPCKWNIYSRAEDKVAETRYRWREFSVSSSERWESLSEKRYLASVHWFKKKQILGLGKLLWVGAELGASKQRISNPYSQMRAPYPEDSSTHLGALSKPYLRNDVLVSSWLSSLQIVCERCGDEELNESIHTLNGMDQRQLVASTHMVIHLLQRCINEDDLGAGRELHRILAREGLNSDTSIGNRLIHMFVYFESLSEAKQAFDTLCRPDVSSWSAIILAHAKLGHNEEAIRLYNQLRKSCVEPDGHVYVAVLKACCGIEALEVGRSIHASIIECGLRPDFFIDSALMDMYMKCWSIDDACMVFGRSLKPNAVMWNVLIAGYAQHVDGHEALQIFKHMQQDGVEADQATFVCVLKACSVTASLQQGKHIHVLVMEAGLESDLFVGSTLIDMYVKCAALEDAIMVFGRLSRRNVVTWSALIAGHVQHGNGFKALQLFQGMLQEGLVPNRVTFICVLKACSSIAALEKGRQCHSFIIERGLETDTVVSSALTDMYGKCGSMKEACTVFNRFPKRDVVTWSALIAGYTQHNDYLSASKCFKLMQDAGWKPDGITFLCLLSACSRVGLLEAGCRHFKSMVDGYGILPILDHFNSMVDLFGHLGLMKEAEDLLETIPYRPNNIGWRSLLSSCRKHSSIDVGRRCFDYIFSTDCTNAAGYVLMAQIYEEAGMQDDVEKVKELRRCAKGWKKPAKAFIEIDKELHEFGVGDQAHSRSDDIFAKLRTLSSQIKAETCKTGLELDPKLVEGKEDAVCGHCEKLAIAFGLISTPQGTTIRIAKNLCMCSDCHLFTKLTSKLERREIIVKDSYQIHNFEDGACSCKDR